MGFEVQKITGNTKTEVSLNNAGFQSMLFANNHASSAVTIDLYITDQTGTNITDTTSAVNLAAGDYIQLYVWCNGANAGERRIYKDNQYGTTCWSATRIAGQ